MKKNRFLFVAMLFAALSLGFVSCDNKGNEPEDPQGEQTEQNGSTENNGGEETPEPESPVIDYNGHAYVDLGLPSGLKWATCNVGATKPEEYGNYYAWGEVEPKEVYDWSTYKFMDSNINDWNGVNKYTVADSQNEYGDVVWYDNSGNFIGDNKTVLEKEDDAATVNMGGSWRMPTKAEQDELRTECTWTWTSNYNGTGVAGRIVTSKINGNSIFLPAAGGRYDSDLSNAGSSGGYWSSSLYTVTSYYAYYLSFDSDDVNWYDSDRYYGRSVRGVIE